MNTELVLTVGEVIFVTVKMDEHQQIFHKGPNQSVALKNLMTLVPPCKAESRGTFGLPTRILSFEECMVESSSGRFVAEPACTR